MAGSRIALVAFTLLLVPAAAAKQPRLKATSWELHIDQDSDRGKTTPIAKLYLREIGATKRGDRIVILQKALTQPKINKALVKAALRGVEILGVYRDKLNPKCKGFEVKQEKKACKAIFLKSDHAHHKSMLILRSNGTVHAVVGSYNTRNQKENARVTRTHTVFFFRVPRGASLFNYYMAEAKRLLERPVKAPLTFNLRAERGIAQLTMHPGRSNPALALLDKIRSCTNTTVWVSYFQSSPDTDIGLPVYQRLSQLQEKGCKVRFLLDTMKGSREAMLAKGKEEKAEKANNTPAFQTLRQLGINVREPSFPSGASTLGHKLVLVSSGDDPRILLSSANLSGKHHLKTHNLTLTLRGKGFKSFHDKLVGEVRRYWKEGD